MGKKLFLLFALFSCPFTYAQNDSLIYTPRELIEEETYLDEVLESLKEHPVNINIADKSRFLELPFLSEQNVDSILALRAQLGIFNRKSQLKKVLGPTNYALVREYIATKDNSKTHFILTQRSTLNVEPNPDIINGTYKGNAYNLYSRIRYNPTPFFTLGIVSQKDPGEQAYTDHLNYSLSYTNKPLRILAGHYFIQFAEGLAFSTPYGNYKSSYISAAFRNSSQWAKTNLTSAEGSGLHGLFSSYAFPQYAKIAFFYSRAARDARLENGHATALKYDGLHRSPSELESKQFLSIQELGSILEVRPFPQLKVSILYNHASLSKAIKHTIENVGEQAYRRNYFNFSGKELQQTSFSYRYQLNYLQLSGEYAYTHKHGFGLTQSLYYKEKNSQVGFKFWHLSKDFITLNGRSFDNRSAFPQGRQGFYYGLAHRLNKICSFSAYYLSEKSLWRGYSSPLPTHNSEWLAELRLKHTAHALQLRARRKNRMVFVEAQRVLSTQNLYRLDYRFQLSRSTYLRNRFSYNFFNQEKESGMAYFSEIVSSLNAQYTLYTRVSFFSTRSFNSRIYEYELDLPGTFSNYAQFEDGEKFYILLKGQPFSYLSVWFKWRYLSKNKVRTNGTEKRVLNRDLRFQLQIKL